MFSPGMNTLLVLLATFFLTYAADAFLRLKGVKDVSEISFKEFLTVYWRRIPIPGIHLSPEFHFSSWDFKSTKYTDEGFTHRCSKCGEERTLTELEERSVNF